MTKTMHVINDAIMTESCFPRFYRFQAMGHHFRSIKPIHCKLFLWLAHKNPAQLYDLIIKGVNYCKTRQRFSVYWCRKQCYVSKLGDFKMAKVITKSHVSACAWLLKLRDPLFFFLITKLVVFWLELFSSYFFFVYLFPAEFRQY